MAAIKLFVWNLDHGYAAAMATSVKSAREKIAADKAPAPLLAQVFSLEPDAVRDFKQAVTWAWAGGE